MLFSIFAFFLMWVGRGWPQRQGSNFLCPVFGFPRESERPRRMLLRRYRNGKPSASSPGSRRGHMQYRFFMTRIPMASWMRNLLGIPREGVGAPTDATGLMAHLNSGVAAFQFVGGRLNVKISVNYL